MLEVNIKRASFPTQRGDLHQPIAMEFGSDSTLQLGGKILPFLGSFPPESKDLPQDTIPEEFC